MIGVGDFIWKNQRQFSLHILLLILISTNEQTTKPSYVLSFHKTTHDSLLFVVHIVGSTLPFNHLSTHFT